MPLDSDCTPLTLYRCTPNPNLNPIPTCAKKPPKGTTPSLLSFTYERTGACWRSKGRCLIPRCWARVLARSCALGMIDAGPPRPHRAPQSWILEKAEDFSHLGFGGASSIPNLQGAPHALQSPGSPWYYADALSPGVSLLIPSICAKFASEHQRHVERSRGLGPEGAACPGPCT